MECGRDWGRSEDGTRLKLAAQQVELKLAISEYYLNTTTVYYCAWKRCVHGLFIGASPSILMKQITVGSCVYSREK